MMKLLFVAAASSFLAACALHGPVEGPVRLGRIASVNGPKVRAEKVIEDSRCPIDRQCVWPGRLIVRTTVLGGGWSRQLDLTLGIPVHVADGSLALVAATPRTRSARRKEKSVSHRFTFEFRGGL